VLTVMGGLTGKKRAGICCWIVIKAWYCRVDSGVVSGFSVENECEGVW
jgi:hypothetical protein